MSPMQRLCTVAIMSEILTTARCMCCLCCAWRGHGICSVLSVEGCGTCAGDEPHQPDCDIHHNPFCCPLLCFNLYIYVPLLLRSTTQNNTIKRATLKRKVCLQRQQDKSQSKWTSLIIKMQYEEFTYTFVIN